MSRKIIIEGVTQEGKKFRPSDWAERVSGNLLTVKNHRMYYSPLLRPSVTESGNKCVVVDHGLLESNPELYEYIMNFAEKNTLKVCDDQHVGDQ